MCGLARPRSPTRKSADEKIEGAIVLRFGVKKEHNGSSPYGSSSRDRGRVDPVPLLVLRFGT